MTDFFIEITSISFGYFHFLMRIQYSKKHICRCRRPLHHKSCIFAVCCYCSYFYPTQLFTQIYFVFWRNILCVPSQLCSVTACLYARVCLRFLIIMMLYNLRSTKCKDGSHNLEYNISLDDAYTSILLFVLLQN